MDFSIKTTALSTMMLLLSTLSAQASDVVYLPAYCEPSALTLTVENKTSEMQRLWTQVRFETELQESYYDLNPKAVITIKGSEFLPEKKGFAIKSWTENSLKINARCEDSASIALTRTTSPQVSHVLPAGTKTVRLHLLNLFLNSNNLTLSAFSKTGTLLETKQLQLKKYYDTETLKWSLPEGVARIEVKGEERLQSVLFYDSGKDWKSSPGIALKPVILNVDPSKTYFLVSTKEARPDESFVIALDDAKTIAMAQDQIKNPNLEKIMVAGIQLGGGGFNRSLSSQDKAPYSWSVHRVDAFADFAHISCDGSPDLTEERLMEKLNDGGRICFWRYRIIKQLSPAEVSLGKLIP